MRIAVIGLGLIGGSALRALAARGHQVRGYSATATTRAMARAASGTDGARWQVAETVAEAVEDAQVAMVAVPLPALPGVFDELAACGYAGIVTDATSVKGPVLEAASRLGGPTGPVTERATFVGGHPMAGTEQSGFTAADPDLFDGCAWVLGLEPGDTDLDAWLTMAELVTALGARAVPATAAEHDAAVATISHVPHLLAAAIAATAGGSAQALTLAAGSFRDGTRVAATRPQLTAAMCGGNAAAVRAVLDQVMAELGRARVALEGGDPISDLTSWLSPGYAVRSVWPAHPVTMPGAASPAAKAAAVPASVEALLALGRSGGWVVGVAPDRTSVTVVHPDRR